MIAISIDLESDFGVKGEFSSTTELYSVLSLLKKHNIKATFFVSTEILSKGLTENDLVNISEQGHEIASHGHRHIDIRKLSAVEFESDILNSKTILESILKKNVSGYRSPYLSFKKEMNHIIEKVGYEYNSSSASLWPSHKNIDFFRTRKNFEVPIASLLFILPLSLTYLRLLNPFSRFMKIESGSLFFHIHEFREIKNPERSLLNRILGINSGAKAYDILDIFLKKKSHKYKFVTCFEYSKCKDPGTR